MQKNQSISKIFSYDELKKKAHREILRLITAENKMDTEAAADHALNAAFTIFHLLEWKVKSNNPSSAAKARKLCEDSKNYGLAMLHDVVTCNKHVAVSSPMAKKEYAPIVSDEVIYLCTESGERMVTEQENPIITSDSKVVVYFGDERALDILQIALKAFESQEVDLNEDVHEISNS